MQTTKEFLDEEQQAILSTQTDANEFFLSRLNESISHIRDDFHQLSQLQYKQIDEFYQQLRNNIQETIRNEPREEIKINSPLEQLQNEQKLINEELINAKEQHEILAEQLMAMVRLKRIKYFHRQFLIAFRKRISVIFVDNMFEN